MAHAQTSRKDEQILAYLVYTILILVFITGTRFVFYLIWGTRWIKDKELDLEEGSWECLLVKV
jgi:hypothetical protein